MSTSRRHRIASAFKPKTAELVRETGFPWRDFAPDVTAELQAVMARNEAASRRLTALAALAIVAGLTVIGAAAALSFGVIQ